MMRMEFDIGASGHQVFRSSRARIRAAGLVGQDRARAGLTYVLRAGCYRGFEPMARWVGVHNAERISVRAPRNHCRHRAGAHPCCLASA